MLVGENSILDNWFMQNEGEKKKLNLEISTT